MTKQKFGALIGEQETTQRFDLGEETTLPSGSKYRYFKNYTTGALTAYYTYVYDPDTWTIVGGLTTTVAASGEVHPLCVPQIAITQGTTATSYYFWAFVGPGEATFVCSDAVAAEAKIYTTATAGTIGDNSSSTVLIPGLISYDAIASATDSGTCHARTELYVSN